MRNLGVEDELRGLTSGMVVPALSRNADEAGERLRNRFRNCCWHGARQQGDWQAKLPRQYGLVEGRRGVFGHAVFRRDRREALEQRTVGLPLGET